MLVDVKPRPDPSMMHILQIVSGVNGNTPDYVRLAKGVYEIGHFSFDHAVGLRWENFEDNYPDLTRRKDTPVVVMDNPGPYIGGEPLEVGGGEEGGYFGSYGVCDTYQQVLDLCTELQDEYPVPFCMSVTAIHKSEQPSSGGWRWHKWGEYIGTQKPTCEYIHDEPNIELVYCYHIYKVPLDMVDTSGKFDQKVIEG